MTEPHTRKAISNANNIIIPILICACIFLRASYVWDVALFKFVFDKIEIVNSGNFTKRRGD